MRGRAAPPHPGIYGVPPLPMFSRDRSPPKGFEMLQVLASEVVTAYRTASPFLLFLFFFGISCTHICVRET